MIIVHSKAISERASIMKSKVLNIILKTLFILSFVPYAYILYGIIFGKYIYNGVELKGIERLARLFVDSISYYTQGLPIIPAVLTYQMCYIFRKKPKKMFACSFIPTAIIICAALITGIAGTTFITSKVYGVDAFLLDIMYGFYVNTRVIPIIPVCVVFQIVFLIINSLKKKNLWKHRQRKL